MTRFLQAALRDPDSAKGLVISQPYNDCYYRGLINGGGNFCGQRVCVSVNAKNAFGAYAGAKVYVFWFRYDEPAGGIFENAGACPSYLGPEYHWNETDEAAEG